MPEQVVQIQLRRGVNQRRSQFAAEPGDLAQAINVRFNKEGMLSKRHGNFVVPLTATFVLTLGVGPVGGSTVLAPNGPNGLMFSLGNDICYGQQWRLYSWSPTRNVWLSRDHIPEAVGTRRALQANSTLTGTAAQNTRSPDACVTSNGYEAYAFVGSTGINNTGPIACEVIEQSTGAVLWSPVLTLSSVNCEAPKLVAVGTSIVLMYVDASASPAVVRARVLDTTAVTWTWSAEVILHNNLRQTNVPAWDVAGVGLGVVGATAASFVLATEKITTGGVQLSVYSVSGQTITLSTGPSVVGTDANMTAIGLQSTSTTVFVSWSANFVKAYAALVSNLSQVFAATTVKAADVANHIALATYNSTTEVVYWNIMPGSGAFSWRMQLINASTGANIGSLITNSNTILMSKPLTYNGKVYAVTGKSSSTQGTYYLVDTMADGQLASAPTNEINIIGRPVAIVAPRQCPSFGINPGQLDPSCLVTMSFATVNSVSKMVTTGSVNLGAGSKGGVRLWRFQFDFQHPNLSQSDVLGHSRWLSGGAVYDGLQASDPGFTYYPEGFTGAVSAGGAMGSGAYQYIVIYKWTSTASETIRSTCFAAPGNQALSVTTSAGNNTVTLSGIPTQNVNCKDEQVEFTSQSISVEIYRTLVNGSIFYLLTTLVNNPSSGSTLSFVDTLSDASISGTSATILYFQPAANIGQGGGVLDNVCPPSSSHTISHKNRIFVIGDDLRTIWFSKSYTEGEQPGFNEQLQIVVEDGSDLVALVSLDEKLLISTQLKWYLVFGDGPSDTGAGSDLSPPQKQLFEQPCSNIRSILQIPEGVVFQGPTNQLYLITRSMECTWFSDRVEDLLSTYTLITSARLFASAHEARWTCAKPDGSAGIVLVYNYYFKEWTWFQLYDATGATASVPVVASDVVLLAGVPTYQWASVLGNLYREDTAGTAAGAYMDGGTALANWVQMAIGMQPINFRGTGTGYDRVNRLGMLGNHFTSADVSIGIQSGNYGGVFSLFNQTKTVTSEKTDGLSPLEVREGVNSPVSHAIGATYSDAYPTGPGAVVGTGQGNEVAAFHFVVLDEPGAAKFVTVGQST